MLNFVQNNMKALHSESKVKNDKVETLRGSIASNADEVVTTIYSNDEAKNQHFMQVYLEQLKDDKGIREMFIEPPKTSQKLKSLLSPKGEEALSQAQPEKAD